MSPHTPFSQPLPPSPSYFRKETSAWKLFEASLHLRRLVLVAAKEHGRRRWGAGARGGRGSKGPGSGKGE